MPTEFQRPRSRQALIILVIAAATMLAVGAIGRYSRAEKIERSTAAGHIPTVTVFNPAPAVGESIELPARIEPWSRAPIYARVSGYLASWNADIGMPVKAGQQLARIDTPDLDQQLLQAQAELATARSNLALSESTAKRWTTLLAENAVSRQEAEERTGDLAARRSALQALQANLQRIEALKRYARLTAPFDGIVTARNTDVGALINEGGGAGSELFVVSDISKLRVYVQVPQRQVAMIRVGSQARLSVPERAGQTYEATVQSLSQAIDTASGAMLVQLSVDNVQGELLPGAYAKVRFTPDGRSGGVSVPPGALIFGKDGPRAAVVDASNRVLVRPVVIGRDLGSVVLLYGGVGASDRVIDSPPDGIADGDAVVIAATR